MASSRDPVYSMIKLDVFGRRMGVEKLASGWRLYYLDGEGKRRLADEVVIPDFVHERGIERYLADIFHESASPEISEVRRLPE